MHREFQRWYSPSLGRDMEMLVFGHAGARVLVFPTSMGRFFEWEDRGMVGAIADRIERGWFQLFCVDSVDEESWYARWKGLGDRAWRQTQYESYLLHEVLPFTAYRNPNPYLITTGASFGAYQAMNLALRHPWAVGRVLAMSGLYDLHTILGGRSDPSIASHNPSVYLPRLDGGEHLAAIQRLDLIMAVGRDDPNIGNNEWFSGQLWAKGVWHALRIWDGWAHDWPWWRDMLRAYIGGA